MTTQNPKTQDRLRERTKRELLELQAADDRLHAVGVAINKQREKIRKTEVEVNKERKRIREAQNQVIRRYNESLLS